MHYPVLRWHSTFVGAVCLPEHVADMQLNSIQNYFSLLEKHSVFLEVSVIIERFGM